MSQAFRLLSVGPRALQIAGFVAALLMVELASGQSAAKRPLTHADYDGWKSVQLPALSRDGRYLAYNLMPSGADGEFVVRNLTTGGEHRVPRGKAGLGTSAGETKAAMPSGEYAETEDADASSPAAWSSRAASGDQQPQGKGFGKGLGKGIGKGPAGQAPAVNPLAGAAHQFTPDSKAIVFALIPTKAEIDKARLEKKPTAELPAPALAVMDLANGKITARIERVSSFSVVGDGAGLLVYRRPAKAADKTEPPAASPDKKEEPKKEDKTPAKAAPRVYGTDLVVRNLVDGSEEGRGVRRLCRHGAAEWPTGPTHHR